MDWILLKAKARRVVSRTLSTAWREFCGPIFNRSELLMLTMSLVGTILFFQYATPAEVDAEMNSWIIGVQSFALVMIGWAVISLLRAPFIVVAADRKNGEWHGRKFIYFQPILAASFFCKATGKTEMYKFKFEDAEPGSFVNFSITLDPKVAHRAKIDLGGTTLTGPFPMTQWPGTGGARLRKSREAIFRIELELETVPTTARIYCHSFSIGKTDDAEGTEGNYQFPVRQTLEGNDRP